MKHTIQGFSRPIDFFLHDSPDATGGIEIELGHGLIALFRNWDDVCQAGGYDTNKIDWAVPQAWFDDQQKKNIYREALDRCSPCDKQKVEEVEKMIWATEAYKYCPQAFWTYEHSHFGEPLWHTTIRATLYTKLWDYIHEFILEAK